MRCHLGSFEVSHSMIQPFLNVNRVCRWSLVLLLSGLSVSSRTQTRGQVSETPPPGGGPTSPGPRLAGDTTGPSQDRQAACAAGSRGHRLLRARRTLADEGPDGVQATVGPLEPGSYRYGFGADGAEFTDPRNIETERRQVVTRSILPVPGAEFMDTRNVPHDTVASPPTSQQC